MASSHPPIPVPPFGDLNTRILNRHRRPLGYIDVSALKKRWEKGEINPVRPVIVTSHVKYRMFDMRSLVPSLGWVQDDQVQNLMNKFDRSAKREYTVITPFSPLEDLEAFLEINLFALGASTTLFLVPSLDY